ASASGGQPIPGRADRNRRTQIRPEPLFRRGILPTAAIASRSVAAIRDARSPSLELAVVPSPRPTLADIAASPVARRRVRRATANPTPPAGPAGPTRPP